MIVNKNTNLAVSLIIICTLLILCGCDVTDFYIFSDISECDNIEVFKTEDAIVTIYDTPDLDDSIDDLEYDDFYAAKYESAELDFVIFAYEFADSDFAKGYFKKQTGIKTDLDVHFLASGGMFKYRVIAIDGCRAYCANTTQKNSKALILFLEDVFSKKLEL